MPAEALTCLPFVPGGSLARYAALKPGDLPTPRHAALSVLEACAAPSVDARRLGLIVGSDPALAAEVLRVANSAFFGLSREVAGVAQAITLLGHRTLRNMVLCLSMRDVLAGDVLHGLDTGPLRDAALRRAVAARVLCERVGGAADECFTLGLLQDLGLLAMFRACPEHIGLWTRFMAADPGERYDLEREVFGVTHDDVGSLLANAWHLPQTLADAIGEHHRLRRAQGAQASLMCRVAWTADWIAALFEPGDERRRVADVREALASEWQLAPLDADLLLGSIDSQVAEAGSALGMALSAPRSYEQVLAEASIALTVENQGMQELNWRLERVLAERDTAALSLRTEIEKAKVVQRSLLPCPRAECWPVDDFDCPFYGINAAARDLSGDFFDFFPLPDGRWYFNLADVSGKGMDAALMMVKTSSLFHCLAKSLRDPAKLLAVINAELCENPVRGMFVTMVAGVYDPASGAVTLVNAGHPPALLVSPTGAVDVIPAQCPPLGVVPEARFQTAEYRIGDGSLYLFTDGLIEASRGASAKLGYAGVVELVHRFAEIAPEERLARLVGTVSRSHGLARDDATILLIERRAGLADHAAAPDIVDARSL